MSVTRRRSLARCGAASPHVEMELVPLTGEATRVANPDIWITTDDQLVVAALLEQALQGGRHLSAAIWLTNELSRARIVPVAQVPPDCMTLYASGRYVDLNTRAIREATLVPVAGRSLRGVVSVLSENGAALFGLRAGQTIRWRDTYGRARALELVELTHQPERANHSPNSRRP